MREIRLASRRAKGDGKRIRRARNYVKRWKDSGGSWNQYLNMPAPVQSELLDAIRFRRYQRAMAILVADTLANS